MKSINLPSGKLSYYPFKVYYFKPLITSIQELCNRLNFIEVCNHWRNRNVCNGIIANVYDGQLWKKFERFTTDTNNCASCSLSLVLNIDWFQPYKHVSYSVGVLYIAVQNLPRNLRFRRENIIICGIIPGPNEPRSQINSYLKPIVDDLRCLSKGVFMNGYLGVRVKIFAFLMCLACDIPAARKCGGFVGHNAVKGCSRCLKSFPTANFGEKPDYGSFESGD